MNLRDFTGAKAADDGFRELRKAQEEEKESFLAVTPFQRAVASHCKGIRVDVGCKGAMCEFADGEPDHSCEAGFSSYPCDSCGSHLAGDRVPATGWWHAGGRYEEAEMRICTDCAMFHANGDEPEDWNG